MLFHSADFLLCFLPLALLGFMALQRFSYLLKIEPGTACSVWLLLVSFAFYASWSVRDTAILLASSLANFGISLWIIDSPEKRRKLLALWVGIALHLVLLGWFKYAGLFHMVRQRDVILPLAISFYCFQHICYLVDAYRGEVQNRSLFRYLLFATFFPQLIAGPISKQSELLPQFAKVRTDARHLAAGATLIMMGLFKKMVVADNLAPYVQGISRLVRHGADLTLAEAWGGAFLYCFQLYFDFSAYSDMAIGLAFLFGVRLPVNFNSPYKAASPIEFWRRWHTTLSRFLRDNLYIPLGGSRKGSLRKMLNLMLVMVLGGIWHGSGMLFAIWGAWHGLLLCVAHALRALSRGMAARTVKLLRPVCVAATFIAVTAGWVVFSSPTPKHATNMLKAMFANTTLCQQGITYAEGSPLAGMGFDGCDYFPNLPSEWLHNTTQNAWQVGLLFVLLFAWVWLLPSTAEIFRYQKVGLDVFRVNRPWLRIRWRPSVWWLIVAALIGTALVYSNIMQNGEVSEFIYFRF